VFFIKGLQKKSVHGWRSACFTAVKGFYPRRQIDPTSHEAALQEYLSMIL